MGVVVIGPLVGFVFCFLTSQICALWSKGRERRAHIIAKLLAGMFLVITLFGVWALFHDHSRDGGGGIAAAGLAALSFLAGLGAGLNILVCGRMARSAVAREVAPEEMGISRSTD